MVSDHCMHCAFWKDCASKQHSRRNRQQGHPKRSRKGRSRLLHIAESTQRWPKYSQELRDCVVLKSIHLSALVVYRVRLWPMWINPRDKINQQTADARSLRTSRTQHDTAILSSFKIIKFIKVSALPFVSCATVLPRSQRVQHKANPAT